MEENCVCGFSGFLIEPNGELNQSQKRKIVKERERE